MIKQYEIKYKLIIIIHNKLLVKNNNNKIKHDIKNIKNIRRFHFHRDESRKINKVKK